MTRRTALRRAALTALHYSGVDSAMAPLTRGIGAIFTLQHVRPRPTDAFAPSRALEVTPQFLEEAIRQVRAEGFEIVSLDEAHFRLIEGDYGSPFVCFTIDDGHRDTLEHAYPVFRRHNLPFTIYVPTDYADGRGNLWWLALEMVIARLNTLRVKIDGVERRMRCRTPAEKAAAYRTLYAWLRGIEETGARAIVRELCRDADVEPDGLCAELMLDWNELRDLAGDPLVSIGAHTRRHLALAQLTVAEARTEIAEGVRRIEREIGAPCRHFSYPYGDAASAGPREFALVRELGLKTGLTARDGLVHRRHTRELTALPRVSLGGDYQKSRYVKVMLSGAPFALPGMKPRESRVSPVA